MIVELQEFPGYKLDSDGHVYNEDGREMTVSANTVGIATVGFTVGGIQVRRSLARMVAEQFVEIERSYPYQVNLAPMHINGNRFDCRAANLMWRPRWLVIRYHREMRENVFHDWEHPIQILETGEVFQNPKAVAMAYGVLQKQVVWSAHTNNGIPMLGYTAAIIP